MTTPKKLHLNLETLRVLNAHQHQDVQGGLPARTITVCDGATCSDFISVRQNLC